MNNRGQGCFLRFSFTFPHSSFLTMMDQAAAEIVRREEFLIEAEFFRRNALLVIKEMDKLSQGCHHVLVDEVLHSILFLGHINEPRFTPEDILCTKLNEYKGRYPRPFQCYSTQLPKRAPISCVLEMIVSMTGQEEVKVIFQRLLQLIDKLKEGETKHLVSNTFCVSQPNKSPETARYYGVSMSTSGRDSGRIMVNACCLSRYWDSYVADAVMTYNPNKQKKTYFDATIKLPNEVKCQAFGFSKEMTEMPPCKSCSNLFGLTTSSTRIWPYGNCAEPESLSNLLRNEKEVKEKSEPKSKTCTDENRRRAEDSVWKETERMLREKLSDRYEYGRQFYTPQV